MSYDVKCGNCGFKGFFRSGQVRMHGFNFPLGCKKCKEIITKKSGEPDFKILEENGKLKINYTCKCGSTDFIYYHEELKEEGRKQREAREKGEEYTIKLTCPACGKKELVIVPGPIRD